MYTLETVMLSILSGKYKHTKTTIFDMRFTSLFWLFSIIFGLAQLHLENIFFPSENEFKFKVSCKKDNYLNCLNADTNLDNVALKLKGIKKYCGRLVEISSKKSSNCIKIMN